jgi:putative drug exporter of the RND superfamily
MLGLARWCSARRRIVVVLWIVVLISVGVAWQGLGSHYSSNFTLGHTGAQRAADLLNSRFPAQSGDVDQIVFRARTGKQIAAATIPADLLRRACWWSSKTFQFLIYECLLL